MSKQIDSEQLILYSFRRCPFAIRVRMVMEEKNLVYTLIEEDLNSPSEQLLALNPEGKVPVLVHNTFILQESAIITEYLDEVFSVPHLLPDDAELKAITRLWTQWCDLVFKPDLDELKYNWDSLSDIQKQDLIARCRQHVLKISSALLKSSYLISEKITLADIHLFPFYRQFQKTIQKMPLDVKNVLKTEIIDAWLEKIISRPSFERVMKKL